MLRGFADRPCGAKPAHVSTRRAHFGLACPDTKFRGNASRRGARHSTYLVGLLSEPCLPPQWLSPDFLSSLARSEGRSHRPSPGRRTLLALGFSAERLPSAPPSDRRPLPAPTVSDVVELDQWRRPPSTLLLQSDGLSTPSNLTDGGGFLLNAASMFLPDGASHSERGRPEPPSFRCRLLLLLRRHRAGDRT